MATALSVQVMPPADGPALVLPAEAAYVTETATGLVFAPDTPIEVWGALTERLIRQSRRIRWAIADAINFGDDHYGEAHAQWVEEIGLADKTLANIASVGRRVPASRRREDIDFSHHEVVAKLPADEQTAWLDRAFDEGLSCFRLREAIKAAEVPTAAPVETGCAADSLIWRPTVDDLTTEARQALDLIAADERVLPQVAARVFLRTLVWLDALDCFRRTP